MSNKNLGTVEAIAQAYIKATFEGDAASLRQLFHPQASMSGYLMGQYMVGTPAPFIEQIENTPSLKDGGAPYKASIDYIHAADNVGSVTISETGFGDMAFTNYLHLINENGSWRIVSKNFESH